MARNWAEVRWCSESCRRAKLTVADKELEHAIDSLLETLPRGATICVAEGEPARMAARRLVAAGRVAILQGNRVVDPSTVKGPIRVRRIDPA